MNRIEFLHTITYNGELPEIVVNFFNQYMLLYDLVDNAANQIIIISNDKSSVCFQLNYSDNESVMKLAEKLSNIPIVIIYETQYVVSFNIASDTSIVINISR